MESVRNNPALAGAQVGIGVKSLTDGTYFARSNDETFFIPASNMKLFTTAAALVLLGPEFRYTTNLYRDEEISDGILDGNLVIRGVGDPTLSGGFHAAGGDEIFEVWAEALSKMGVREVRGTIIGDGSLFGDEYLGAGWAWDDDLYCYSAEISALSVNDNCVAVSVGPGAAPGEAAQVAFDDPSGYLGTRIEAITSARDEETSLRLSREAGSNLLVITGSIPAGADAKRFSVAVHRPALFAAAHLARALESKGIRVTGAITDEKYLSEPVPYGSMKVVASYNSPPLRQIIKETNKASRNLDAELLFRTMGARFTGDGSSRAAAQLLRVTLIRMSVPPGSVLVYDGSGLSRMNLVTPSALLSLLEYMYRHDHFSYFFASLPVAGVDGTLTKRMKNTRAEGNVSAKTGSMTHVLNLSGYMKGRKGGLYAFSMLLNNFGGPLEPVRVLQDSFLERLIILLE